MFAEKCWSVSCVLVVLVAPFSIAQEFVPQEQFLADFKPQALLQVLLETDLEEIEDVDLQTLSAAVASAGRQHPANRVTRLKAELSYRNRDWSQASLLFAEYLESFPDDLDCQIRLVQSLVHDSQFDRAVLRCTSWQLANTPSLSLEILRAHAYLNNAETEKAREILEATQAEGSQVGQWHFTYTVLLAKCGEFEAALPHARLALSSQSPYPLGVGVADGQELLSSINIKLGRWDDAERALRKAFIADPSRTDMIRRLWKINFQEQREFLSAYRIAKVWRQAVPDSKQAAVSLAKSAAAMNEYSLAQEILMSLPPNQLDDPETAETLRAIRFQLAKANRT